MATMTESILNAAKYQVELSEFMEKRQRQGMEETKKAWMVS